ncbi:MAG: THUMP domain-containing protein [Myxococcota bacterium]
MEFFATAARGTEGVLLEELRELGFGGLDLRGGGVKFEGEWVEAFRACLCSRIAMRILYPLTVFTAADERELYEGVEALEWRRYLSERHTLMVTAVCRSSNLTHSHYIALKTKDGVVDKLRKELGARPSVSRDDPDVHIFVHLVKNRATIYLDLSGEPLHKRGWRLEGHIAPLKETLAAAMVRLSGWDKKGVLIDPMCGSGTIAIEAGLIAGKVAPGLFRKRFGFERWANHDSSQAAVAELREKARAEIRQTDSRIVASDIECKAVEVARSNAERAGVRIEVKRASALDIKPCSPPAVIVTNPPYGRRSLSSAEFRRGLRKAFMRLKGHRICFLLEKERREEKILPIKPIATYDLFNGDIECGFYVFEV